MRSRLHRLPAASTSLFVLSLLPFALLACGGADIPPLVRDAGAPIDALVPVPDARLDCPDPLPAPTACDFFLSCGCDVAGGEKCSINNNTNQRGCFLAGPGLTGATCDHETECQAGTLCAIFGGSTAWTCMQYCDDAHDCPADLGCYLPVENVADATVCGPICDLLGQDCGIADQGCYPFSKVKTEQKGICVLAGAGVNGTDCTKANDCAEGFTCVAPINPGGPSKCRQMCGRDGSAPTCATGSCLVLQSQTHTGYCN
jgi:hypothetical protein